MTFDNLVKVTTILPNGGDVAVAREARSNALGDHRPASTLIVGGLANPAWKIEISRALPSLDRATLTRVHFAQWFRFLRSALRFLSPPLAANATRNYIVCEGGTLTPLG